MIKLLDCTLRDGGYINNWEFGYEPIKDIISHIEKTDVDIIEMGFIRDEPYDRNRAVFNSMDQIEALIPNKKPGMKYAAMLESILHSLPIERLKNREEGSVDALRVVVWKDKHDETGKVVDCLEDTYAYCKGVVDRGYALYIQIARVGQYSDEDFVEILNKCQDLEPEAVYVVDTWGNLGPKQIMRYVSLADKTLSSKTAIGFHGHNLLDNAFANGVEFLKSGLKRDLYIDGSIYGIGRYVGNLQSEVIASYLNLEYGKKYNIAPMIDVYDKYLEKIRDSHVWGYYFPYYLAAIHNCNPRYIEYYFGMGTAETTKKISCAEFEKIIAIMSEDDKIMFNRKRADEYLQRIR